MGYDEQLAARVRRVLSGRRDIVEKRMVGGLSFLVNGSMCCGVTNTSLMVRVGPEALVRTLAQRHVRPMKFAGRRLVAFVLVDPAGCRTERALGRWVQKGLEFVSALPAKNLKRVAKRPMKPASSQVAGDVARRVAGVIEAFRADPGLTPVIQEFEANKASGARKFGSNGLKVNGKLFALFTQGTLVVKLPKERVTALIAAKAGKAFDPGHGRLMKEWVALTSPKASWIDLAKEAYRFVRDGGRAR